MQININPENLHFNFNNPKFYKPETIIGNNIIFKNATIEDTEFILQLRVDNKKNTYLSKVTNDFKLQEKWLLEYSNDSKQVYFIILNKNQEKIGTVRLYDQKNDSFCWGSWILKDGCPTNYAVETALLVYMFALQLGFKSSHFDVRKGNESVWKFHERFGAIRTHESEEDFFYSITFDAIKKSLIKYKKFLPNTLIIEK